jgi:hypothetical protein
MANHENDEGDGLTFWEWNDFLKIIDCIHHHITFKFVVVEMSLLFPSYMLIKFASMSSH